LAEIAAYYAWKEHQGEREQDEQAERDGAAFAQEIVREGKGQGSKTPVIETPR